MVVGGGVASTGGGEGSSEFHPHSACIEGQGVAVAAASAAYSPFPPLVPQEQRNLHLTGDIHAACLACCPPAALTSRFHRSS